MTRKELPRGDLKSLADHGELGALFSPDGGDSEEVLAQFAQARIDVDAGRAASG